MIPWCEGYTSNTRSEVYVFDSRYVQTQFFLYCDIFKWLILSRCNLGKYLQNKFIKRNKMEKFKETVCQLESFNL